MKKQTNIEEIMQLIEGCKAGKRRAQHQFFKLYYGKAMSVCFRYAQNGDEAEDMVSEGFMKVFENLDKYKPEGSFNAWFKQVLVRTAIDYQRKFKTLTQTVDYEEIPETSLHLTDENAAIAKISADELLELIQQLPPVSRNVFNLYVFEEYPHAQIAEMLNIKEGTSHWHLNFARTKLKEMINEIYR